MNQLDFSAIMAVIRYYINPVISRYYLKKRNRAKLAEDIEQYLLPLMYDSDMAVQELYRRPFRMRPYLTVKRRSC